MLSAPIESKQVTLWLAPLGLMNYSNSDNADVHQSFFGVFAFEIPYPLAVFVYLRRDLGICFGLNPE